MSKLGYAFNWFKSLFSKTNNNTNTISLASIPEPKFDIKFIISKLELFKDKKIFQEYCEKYRVKLNNEKFK